jgi:uncharacterized membrane protein YozB (DUF420 family)
MDPRLAYWTGAWLNMLLIVGVAGAGILLAHRGQYHRHRQCMLASAALVLLFVLSYGVKLLTLGREALETWSAPFVAVLRLHEACVGFMLLAGTTAMVLAYRAQLESRIARRADADLARKASLHRRSGALAFGAALAGVVTAAYLLYGMYERLPDRAARAPQVLAVGAAD